MEDCCCFTYMLILQFTVFNCIVLLGGALSVWLPLPTPERFLPSYPAFWEQDFDNCTSAEVLETLRLSNSAFKAENVVAMMLPFLIILGCCCCHLLRAACWRQISDFVDIVQRAREATV